MPPEEKEAKLATYQCRACLRQYANHSPTERQTCHDYLLSIVTITHRVERQNTLHDNDEEKLGRPA